MTETSLDIFYRSPAGFGEHIQIKAESPLAAFEERARIIELLQSVNAEPLLRDTDSRPKFQAPFSGPAKRDPMEAAAASTGLINGASVSAICPNDGSAMKFVPGGTSRKTNRPYPAFHACNDCGHKANAAGQ